MTCQRFSFIDHFQKLMWVVSVQCRIFLVLLITRIQFNKIAHLKNKHKGCRLMNLNVEAAFKTQSFKQVFLSSR